MHRQIFVHGVRMNSTTVLWMGKRRLSGKEKHTMPSAKGRLRDFQVSKQKKIGKRILRHREFMRIIHISQSESIDPVARVSDRLPIRLSPQQAEAIREIIEKSDAVRMEPSEYEVVHRKLKSIPIAKAGLKDIRNVKEGYEKNEVKLLPNFNAKTDIPEGYGLYSMYDSGSNHRMANAAEIAWTHIWNFWTNYKTGGTYGKSDWTDRKLTDAMEKEKV